ncbi:AAA family ATPase [Marinobacter salsuginis]|jgi:chromosome partitioning protein|uniref:AAA family ATPase n=1 Tax=Marinobacter salsuginis TaxID=418719 RepID=UPI000787D54D|nr:AAA family ATPase [Marinobacter salsuginis]|eukprot:TRINITY_DN56372_c0_g1_i1.p1 TRINITY_DN56372_c0_g1~~TRINITY_DN56372_c0_g1_i1.p1  ORF type:complete len:427 (+),score=-0.59 TRINITY_DN56372_c0_g1_i1:82-1362(+)
MVSKTESGKWLGPGEQTDEYLAQITEAGYDILEDARSEVYSFEEAGSNRPAKLWPASQAAAILGRSVGWLREVDPDNPIRNASGHTAWSLKRLMAIADRVGGLLYQRPPGTRALILAMAKFKGGVGNSCNAAHIAHGLAIKGLKVLAVDLDAQASLTAVLGGLIPDIHLEIEDLPNEALIRDPSVIANPDMGVIKPTYFHNVDLVCANSYLNRVEQHLSSYHHGTLSDESGLNPAERLKVMLSHVEQDYDVILLDCPPTLGMLTTNALEAADGIISSVRPEAFDRTSLVSFFDTVQGHAEITGKNYDYIRILISQSRDRLPLAGPDNAQVNVSGMKEEDVREGHRRNEFKLRRDYGDAIMKSTMDWSPAFGQAIGRFSTVFSAQKRIGSRSSWDRGISIAQSVVDEVYSDLKAIWELHMKDQEEAA